MNVRVRAATVATKEMKRESDDVSERADTGAEATKKIDTSARRVYAESARGRLEKSLIAAAEPSTNTSDRCPLSPPPHSHKRAQLGALLDAARKNTTPRENESMAASARPPYLARPHPAPAGGVESEVEAMFETLTIAQIREVS
jgi:hypothetical protein